MKTQEKKENGLISLVNKIINITALIILIFNVVFIINTSYLYYYSNNTPAEEVKEKIFILNRKSKIIHLFECDYVERMSECNKIKITESQLKPYYMENYVPCYICKPFED